MIYAAEQLFLATVTPTAINTKITALNALYSGQPSYPAAGVPAINQVDDGESYGPLDDQIQAPAILYIIGLKPGELTLKTNQKSDLTVHYELLYISPADTFRTAKIDAQVTNEAILFLMEALEGQTLGTNPQRGVILVNSPEIEMVGITSPVGGGVVKWGMKAAYDVELRMERTSTL